MATGMGVGVAPYSPGTALISSKRVRPTFQTQALLPPLSNAPLGGGALRGSNALQPATQPTNGSGAGPAPAQMRQPPPASPSGLAPTRQAPNTQTQNNGGGAADPSSLTSAWQQKGYINPDGTITTAWGQNMPLDQALRQFYPSGPPRVDEVPAWYQMSAGTRGGMPGDQWSQLTPSMQGWAQQMSDYNNMKSIEGANFNPHGQPLPNLSGIATVKPGDPSATLSAWQRAGYVNPDGTVSTPMGQRISLEDALRTFYPSGPPNANEVPRWFSLPTNQPSGVPINEWNQVNVGERAWMQQLYDSAYKTLGTMPPVTNAQAQAQYGQ